MQDSGFQLFESNKVDTNLSEDLDEHMEDELTGSIGDMFDMEDSGLQDHCKNSVSEDLNDHMEDTNGTPDEEFDDRILFKGKPYKDLTLEDLRGVEFKSVEDVDRFYSYYSLAMGFSMRKFKLDKNRSGTQFNRRVLVCSKQVASVEGMHVTRTDLQCLGPRELVCSLVINIFVEYLNEIGKEDWYVPTYFGRNSIKMGDNMSTQEWIQQTKRIFIPMHDPGIQEKDAHWYLLVVHVRDRSAEILDSAPNPSKTISRQRDARAAVWFFK
ncbi:uncharacterized protein LOC112196910 isoform X2 [Rosa chinensis]|uniref:uncharacterized protein LOC112196910 isoform X2 n=1 Tax=Rosa chinensis TaxID=74649 RepID=UPI001AD90500|nr:uncharacterized protein LOC112196910 isoform X2 [Rosa chinensis]